MNILIIEQLQSLARRLAESGAVDFDINKLCEHLNEAAAMIEALTAKAAVADSLLQQFREDLLTRARAVARLTGSSSRLIERLISSEQLSLDELLTLKRDIEAAFDTAFGNKLHETAATPADEQEQVTQFKIG